MAIPCDAKSLDQAAYIENPKTPGDVDRRVHDVCANEKLDQIIVELGGAPGGTTATIYNVNVPNANTEVSQALPASTKGFTIRVRDNSKLQLAFISGDSGIKFITVHSGSVLEDKNLYSNLTLYFQTSKASQVVEIVAYS